jgi:hypothetical protein
MYADQYTVQPGVHMGSIEFLARKPQLCKAAYSGHHIRHAQASIQQIETSKPTDRDQ